MSHLRAKSVQITFNPEMAGFTLDYWANEPPDHPLHRMVLYPWDTPTVRAAHEALEQLVDDIDTFGPPKGRKVS